VLKSAKKELNKGNRAQKGSVFDFLVFPERGELNLKNVPNSKLEVWGGDLESEAFLGVKVLL